MYTEGFLLYTEGVLLYTDGMSDYSVLMSVYKKDRPEFFRQAAASVLNQSQKPVQFVLVQDGPLTPELEGEIRKLEQDCRICGICFQPVVLEKNGGLGPALNAGLPHCSEELVARMDADDISLPERCARQAAFLDSHPETDVLSGTLVEFEGEVPSFDALIPELVRKTVPETDMGIRRLAALRNPVNHPCVMYRRSAVLAAGGYRSVPLFEDYDLWLRMLEASEGKTTGKLANLPEELLLMRTDGMYERRGGLKYAKHILSFRTSMYRKGYMSLPSYLYTTGARVAVSLLPGSLRKLIYRKILR